MKLLLRLVSLCLVTRSGMTSADGNGPTTITVAEGSDVILPCSLSTNQNIESELFDWTKDAQRDEPRKEVFLYDAGVHYNNNRPGQSVEFKGRVFHFPDELNHSNASITIRRTTIDDRGSYTCFFPRLQPPQRFHVELVVGAAPKPSVTSLKVTKDSALLQCEVRGDSPEPKVEWKDSDGNTLPAKEPEVTGREGRYDIILNTTVTKTDYYRCVVTQETIHHQVYAETHVYISGNGSEEPSGSNAGWIIAVVGALLVGVVIGVVLTVLVSRGYITLNRSKSKAKEQRPSGEPRSGSPGEPRSGSPVY